jgi:aminoglycoside phosphotransferase family enzyme/predicted kinase
MEISALLESLSTPSAYPYPVDEVEVRQTHISAVFLAGAYVYKVKKAVNLGFVDFSTLDKRRHFCEEEVRLNRRLAPQVYLGVVPIVRTASGYRLEEDGEIVEWAVKMQRLSDADTFLEYLRRREIHVEHVEALARRIASFHRIAETDARIAEFGSFARVSRNISDIFDRAQPQRGSTVHEYVFARIKLLAEQALTDLRPLIERRAINWWPRDCHGDLHLDHVYLFPDREPPSDIVIIDCIEFNECFRFIDPVADMAFPVMDCKFYGRNDLARTFLEAYFRASGDEDGRSLLPLYTAYRALVRGMVEGLLLAERETKEVDRVLACQKAQAHWLLALTELEEPGRRPCLILITGLPGTGKSTLAHGLVEKAGFCQIRSDVVRKELAGLPVYNRSDAETRQKIYTPEWNERTYAECLRRAEQLLFEGKRAIVDATFLEEKSRQRFLDAAVRWGVPGHIVLCQIEPTTVRHRLARRKDDASDADWTVYLKAAENSEGVAPTTNQVVHAVSNEGSPDEALSHALEVLRQVGLAR